MREERLLPQAPAPARKRAEPGRAPAGRAAAVDDASLAVLAEAARSLDYETRLIALQAVEDSRLEAGLPWLEQALGDPERDVRLAAVEALKVLRSSRAESLLRSVRDDTTEALEVRAVAAAALLSRSTHGQE